MARLLVVAGLAREARLAVVPDAASIVSGGDPQLLARRLAAVDSAGVDGVLSFGLAGGLDPGLRPGDLVVGTAAIAEQARFDASDRLTDQLRKAIRSAGLPASDGVFAGVDAPVLTPAAKAALRAKSGARAVDMESHVAGRWAADHGLPFAILRAVGDPAERALPTLAARALTPDGEVALGRVLAGLARAPGDLGALLAAGRDSRSAFLTLEKAGLALATV